MEIEIILTAIRDISLISALQYLSSQGINDFLKPGYEKIAKAIRDKQREKRYAFVPNRTEAMKLKKLGEDPDYNAISLLIPRYKYIDLIRTGLLILEYNRESTTETRARVSQIKKQILNRPGGGRFIKIVNLPSTQFFSSILKYLHELKINNYSEVHIEEEFEEIVEDWSNTSLFVENIDDVDRVRIFCHSKAEEGIDRFFILGMKDMAISIVEKAIDKLNQENFFVKNFYRYKIFKDPEVNKIEVIVTRKDLI